MADRYENFAALDAGEERGVHYDIRSIDRGTEMVVLAPHGGCIEPGSSEVAEAIAQRDYSFYAFLGLSPGRDLHITSTNFDEPQAVKLVRTAETAIAIHGRLDHSDPETVWIGGRDVDLGNAVATALEAACFGAITEGHHLLGKDARNICNRGRRGAGAQLEIPRGLRDRLGRDDTELQRFAEAIRTVLVTR